MSSESDPKEHQEAVNRPWVEAVVRRIQQGSASGEDYDLLFREYGPIIRRKLRFYRFRASELDDLAQEVMLRVYKGIGSYRQDSSFDTWIQRIMINAVKNARRDQNTGKARITRDSLDSLLDAAGGSGPTMAEPKDSAANPLDAALASERKSHLEAALDKLPERVRQCLLLRREGYKYREIAAAQRVSVDTVRKQVIQGHKRLRPLLGHLVGRLSVFLALVMLAI